MQQQKTFVPLHHIHQQRVNNLYGKTEVSNSINKSKSFSTVFEKVAYTPDNDVLEKGIASDLRYSSQIFIEKTGKEIKEALKKYNDEYDAQKIKLTLELAELRGSIGVEPTEDFSAYGSERLKTKIGETMIKRYPWQETYCGEKPQQDAPADVVNNYNVSVECCNKKRDYNDKLFRYTELCVEMCYMDTLNNNLDDKKKYNLTVEQASMLGF